MKKIEILLNILKINKLEFSKNVHISQGHLSRVLSDKGKLTYEQLVLINEKYNVNLNWLLSESGDMFNDNYHQSINNVNEEIITYTNNESDKKNVIVQQIKEKDPKINLDGVNYIGLQVILKLILSIEKRIIDEKLKYLEDMLSKKFIND